MTVTFPNRTQFQNFFHAAGLFAGWLSLAFGLVQTSATSIIGGNPKYGQWLAGIGAGIVLLSKLIDSANNALGGPATCTTAVVTAPKV